MRCSHARLDSTVLLLVICVAAATSAASHSGTFGDGPTITLGNQALSATWSTDKASLQGVLIEDRVNKKRITLSPDVFTLLLKDGTTLKSSAMRVNGPVRSEAAYGGTEGGGSCQAVDRPAVCR
jgi:hypothetical protein